MLVNLRSLSQYVGLMDSEALILPQFTLIDRYHSLISENEIPVLSEPKLEEDMISHLDSGGYMDHGRSFTCKNPRKSLY
jgi:hypothetical protein